MYLGHLTDKDLEEQVTLATGYLIFDWQNWHPPLQLPASFAGIPFFDPSLYDHTNTINDLMNNTGLPSNQTANPPYNVDELLKNYSVSDFNLGITFAQFLNGNQALKNAAKNYNHYHNYSQKSKYLLKKFIESFKDDEAFNFASGFFRSCCISHQDYPEFQNIFRSTLSTNAVNYGFENFGWVMAAMSNYSNNYVAEGKMIKKFLSDNPGHGFANFTDYELGKLFDFYDGGANNIAFRFSQYTQDHIINMQPSIPYNIWFFNDAFNREALYAILNGGYVDFKKSIIYHESFNNYPCQKTVISSVFDYNAPVLDLINDVFSTNTKARLIIKAGNLNGILEAANTTVIQNQPLIYNITYNTQRLDVSTNLDFVNTTIHEALHALLFYFYQAGFYNSSINNPTYATLVNDFALHQEALSGLGHHDYIATIINIISEGSYVWSINNGFNPSNFSQFDLNPNDNKNGLQEYLYALSWAGLEDTPTFDLLYPENSSERNHILNITNSEALPYEYNANPQGTPCN